MKKAKQISDQQRMLNVISNIKKLLSESDEFGDFGKTKTIPAINLKLSLDALDHLKTLTELNNLLINALKDIRAKKINVIDVSFDISDRTLKQIGVIK